MNDNKVYEENVLIERVYKKVFESFLDSNKREEKKTLTLQKKDITFFFSQKKRSNFYKNSETNFNVVLIYLYRSNK